LDAQGRRGLCSAVESLQTHDCVDVKHPKPDQDGSPSPHLAL
jgi:hypothetical protein